MSTSFHPEVSYMHDPNNPARRSPRELQGKLGRCEPWERPVIALQHCLEILDRTGYGSTSSLIKDEVLSCLPCEME